MYMTTSRSQQKRNATANLHLICITFDRGERGPQVVQMMEEDLV